MTKLPPLQGAELLRAMSAAVGLAARRERQALAGTSGAAADYLASLLAAGELLGELSKAAAEGERRSRGIRGGLALLLGAMASRLRR